MNLLLDTHTMLWFFWDDPLLSTSAKALIEDPANRKLVSIASCWEVAIKAGLGKLKLGEPSESFLSREITRNNFELLPISLHHAYVAGPGLPAASQSHSDFPRHISA